MASNKEKIIHAALKLFNKDGIVNVRLQHISDECIVSLGNIAYHYPNKEAILQTIYNELTTQQEEVLAEFRTVPLFENLDRLFHSVYLLQQEYNFFYLDILEIQRSYPTIGEQYQQYVDYQISQIKLILDFNRSRGALMDEDIIGTYDILAIQIWMAMDMWLYQQHIRSLPTDDIANYKRHIWNHFIPYFTKMGMQEYRQMLDNPYEIYF